MNIVDKVRSAGVIGAGGAGFPTHVKLGAHAKWLILNAAECEPLLRVDQQLCETYAQLITELMMLVANHLGADKAVIGIKKKHQAAAAALQIQAEKTEKVSVFLLEDFYPAGDEQILVAEVTGQSIPELGLPLRTGCVVINVETLLNIGAALRDIPVTDTCLTVTGCVTNPCTLWLPIGTSYQEALMLSGAEDLSGMAIIDGGPMMGRIVTDVREPITKTTKGIILLPAEHRLIQRKNVSVDQARRISKTACEQCRMCTDLCPRYLIGHNMQPHKMMRKVNFAYERLEDATIAQLCCECNLCELYSCPVNLAPKTVNVLFKQRLSEAGIRHQPNAVTELREIREYRKTPVKRLITKLGIQAFDVSAPMVDTEYVPKEVRILMKQHIGTPAQPVVAQGDLVKKGQLIGEIPTEALGARIHASIDGVVSAVENGMIIISAK